MLLIGLGVHSFLTGVGKRKSMVDFRVGIFLQRLCTMGALLRMVAFGGGFIFRAVHQK